MYTAPPTRTRVKRCGLKRYREGLRGAAARYRGRRSYERAMADSEVTGDVRDTEEQQSMVSRVGSLPLVQSACGMVSSAYSTTKDSVPLLRGVMDVAESGVRTLGAAASAGSKPLLDMLEPQSEWHRRGRVPPATLV
ncbi:perilipin-3-like isoform X2 [Arapaima gigas]